jgi:DNA-binding response OmpR family regulator/HPt (histidine-containing phosphotransfer) domain-containing protein
MRVLLIEDDGCIAKSLETVLAKENYAVDVAVDGELGWQFIESFAYDLILLDVVLPKLDGITLCRQIREHHYQTPVLLLTACNSSTDRVIGLDAGADDYMVKPFELAELLARMRVLLRRGSSPVVPLLEWQQLRIDPASCQVTYSEQLLNLTPKEYRLLELFLRKPRHVFTRSAILEHLWGVEEMPSEDTITAHIKGLRQKLKQVGAPANFIETVYGIGYRLKQSVAETDSTSHASEPPIYHSSHHTTEHSALQSRPVSPQEQSLKQQSIQVALQTVWNKYASKNREYVQMLKRSLTVLQSQALSDQQWQQAQVASHKLAGTLGLFGRSQGSDLASALEQFFRAQKIPSAGDWQTLTQQIDELDAIVCHNSVSTLLIHQPLVLILIDDDTAWVEQFQQLSAHQFIQMSTIEELEVYLKLYPAPSKSDSNVEISPFKRVLLNLPLADLSAQQISWLKTITHQTPPALVFVCTEHAGLDLRVKLAQAGVYAVLPKLLPEQVLNLVKHLQLSSATAQKRILMVDDNPQVLDMLQSSLEPWGLQINRLENSQQFWEMLQSCLPDLLILDIEMPAYSGIDLCRTVRNTFNWHDLPILFLTAHTDAATLKEAVNAGANALIYKSATQTDIVYHVLLELQRVRS